MTSSNGNIFRVTGPFCGKLHIGEFPSQRPVTRSVYVFFHLRRNKRLSKQSEGWIFDSPSCSLWRHCNDSPHKAPPCHDVTSNTNADEQPTCRNLNKRTTINFCVVKMGAMASEMTSLTIVYSTVRSGADQRKHQSSAPLAFLWGIPGHRWIPRTNGQ